MTTGESISRLRKERGLSEKELAEGLGCGTDTVKAWESDAALPKADEIMRLKAIFDVSFEEILCGESGKNTEINPDSLDTVCAAIAYAMGIKPPNKAAEKNRIISEYTDKAFGGERADRVIMYNPDAIAQWIDEKYREYLNPVVWHSEIAVPLASVMPSVTPVCFGTMYTGAQPEVHGIRKYEKPVITIETLFDALIAAGKKPALVTYGESSLSKIYLERNMDYYQFDKGGIEAVNAKAIELILRDEHDFIAIYNGNYDSVMHKCGPEDPRSLAQLHINAHMFAVICEAVKSNWRDHNTLVGFAMDHGCHEIDGGCGSHGLDMKEDINILHRYMAYPREMGK